MSLHTAESIARAAHAGQLDKAGRPYVEHVERVVALVTSSGADAMTVAWLHDVLEDSPTTAADLLAAGISPAVVAAVVVLTRTPPFDYASYVEAVAAAGGLALLVKRADLVDHLSNPGCPPSLRPRYVAALDRLAAVETSHIS